MYKKEAKNNNLKDQYNDSQRVISKNVFIKFIKIYFTRNFGNMCREFLKHEKGLITHSSGIVLYSS